MRPRPDRAAALHGDAPLPGIAESTVAYETWLGHQVAVRRADLKIKHERMSATPLAFLRGTFYRFMQRWPALAGDLDGMPVVPSVGDIHLENFGTWRDAAGRLVWGVNDFDEAAALPYALDLVRLGVSAWLSVEAGDLSLPAHAAATAVLTGYRDGLRAGGRPFVLEAEHAWLRRLVTAERRAEVFWANLEALPRLKVPVPRPAATLLRAALPSGGRVWFAHRVVGLGSLGRARLLACTEWQGGPLAMEAKALVPSAAAWMTGLKAARSSAQEVLAGCVRSPDPSVSFRQGFALRRLSPSAQRLDLSDLSGRRDERQMLRAMGQEIANVHLGAPQQVRAILHDLQKRTDPWFAERMEQGARQVNADLHDWRAALPRH
ncbi:DUF2252 family protein [Deinococcus sp.]|uniref:DUF2252 family protein n=1 Tax=Deinococcus sp. TaxID=47478 RepID=UPI003C79E211